MIEDVNSEREIKIKYKEQTNIRNDKSNFPGTLPGIFSHLQISYHGNLLQCVQNHPKLLQNHFLLEPGSRIWRTTSITKNLTISVVHTNRTLLIPNSLRSVYNAQLYSAKKVFSRTKKEKEEERTFFYYERGNGCTWNYSYQPITLLVGIRSYTRSPIDHSYM